MPEILDDHAIGPVNEDLLTAHDPLELCQAFELKFGRVLAIEQEAGRNRGHGGVSGVKQARQSPLHAPPFPALPKKREGRAVGGLFEIDDDRIVVGAGADANHWSPRHVLDEAKDVGVIAIGNDGAVARDNADDMREGAQDIVEVAEDIGVVELAVINGKDMRQVLDKLTPLIEKSRVVFIALDDKRAAGLTGVRTVGEVTRHPTNEPTRVCTIGLQQNRRHAGGRRLPVRTGDNDVAPLV